MSIQVEPDELGDALRVYRFAYLITVGDGGRSHVVAVTPTLGGAQDEQVLVVGDLGTRSLANLAANSSVTLVWPPAEPTGHSLIADGVATVDTVGGCRVRVGRAVLHRPAPSPAPGPDSRCGADCVELGTGRPID